MNFIKNHIHSLLIPLSLLWMEIVFHLSTAVKSDNIYWFHMLLFSLVYGAGIEWIISFIRKRSIYKIIKAICLALAATLFIVMYFIYCEFNVFYDINTVLNGAKGVAGEFTGDVYALVFCPNGIEHILLFMVPTLTYLFLNLARIIRKKSRKIAQKTKFDTAFLMWKVKTQIFIIFLLLFALIWVYASNESSLIYDKNYNFETAIKQFGLLTAVRLDIKNNLIPHETDFDISLDLNSLNKEAKISTDELVPDCNQENGKDKTEEKIEENSTESQEKSNQETTSVEATTKELTPEEYGENVLDINFKKLEKNASKELVDLDEYVKAQTPSHKNKYTGLFKGKNLIFITAEAFTAEAIDKELTPTLYRLAHKGIQFTDYYQPASAGTTGGEYANIMGMLPTDGGSSMIDTEDNLNYMTIGNLLNEQGYYGKAFHNNSYTYYDRNNTHINLGYSDGYMGYGNGMEKYVQNLWPESDWEMFKGTLPTYINKQPFNIYYMSVSGHSTYSYDTNAMARKNWDKVKNLKCSDKVKAYYACQIELENGLKYIIKQLEKKGIADDTVIVIGADHFPYGLDMDGSGNYEYLSELYGCEIDNNLTRDHNRLIIWSGCLEDMDPIVVDQPTFSPDILPTLCNLFGIDYDSRLLIGRDVLSDAAPLVFTLGYEWKTELGTYAGGVFTPVNDKVKIPDNYVSSVTAIVQNKINYSKGVLEQDYYRHVFGNKK